MKVRITFEAGDCVEPEMIGRTFENSGKPWEQDGMEDHCSDCAFDKFPDTCMLTQECDHGAFVEVQGDKDLRTPARWKEDQIEMMYGQTKEG